MRFSRSLALFSSLVPSTLGTPVPNIIHDLSTLETRDSPGTIEILENAFLGFFNLDKETIQQITLLESALKDVQAGKINPVTTLEEAFASLAEIPPSSNEEHNILTIATNLVLNGLAPQNTLDLIAGIIDQDINSSNNNNTVNPPNPIYPKKETKDAPYSQSEQDLRSVIFIPETFEYGANNRTPVLLVPGTADPAGSTYHFSYAKLLAESDFADPVWVNIPGNSLGDIQVNAEYVAYAMNYISAISNASYNGPNGRKIGVISWSQGGIDVQWALKYWPSTRDIVEDFMALSADFHGTLFAAVCLTSSSPLCTPSIKQQYYNSNLIHALWGGHERGDFAFVPTTSVYSGVDQVVQPQIGTNASAYLLDERGVGVSNVQIQVGCPGLPAGGFYLHETMLVNPLAFALFADAITHDGPGDLARVDLDTVCNQLVPPGLGLDDLLGTEVMALVYGSLDTLTYGYVGDNEPPIKEYAKQ
ncbi:hypothetical protein N7509_003657 [Penicillium cosmopolitanum]|uniref:Lipase B n=1 Tax=Penicillium cosmopolitanum TaxID=1131564 RepID=A0A9W9W5J3_9EURO|nr:uncharacterized protein N7509_003657 [Penicillium cosmopolitanum]KAJ5403786.1 hypothetical protein N7509_003657 [Penicillium cosmopolitanum]